MDLQRNNYSRDTLRLPQLSITRSRQQARNSNNQQNCCRINLYGFIVYSHFIKMKWLRLSSPVYEFKDGIADSRILSFLKDESKRNKKNPGKLEWNGDCEILYSREFPISILDENRKSDFGDELKNFHQTLVSARQRLLEIRNDCDKVSVDQKLLSRGFFDNGLERRKSCPSLSNFPKENHDKSTEAPGFVSIAMAPYENENHSTSVLDGTLHKSRGEKTRRRMSLPFRRKSVTKCRKDSSCEVTRMTRKTCATSTAASQLMDDDNNTNDDLADFIYPERHLPSDSNDGFCQQRKSRNIHGFLELNSCCSSDL